MKREKSLPKILLCNLAAGLMIAAVSITAQNVYAENYTDTAPYIQPAESNGSDILFDNTHAQTAGAADWVIDGGFSDYATALANEGYYVTELRKNSEITYADLQNYEVFIIPEANIPYKATEQAAILQYVENGGSVFFIADHYNADRNKNRWDAAEVFNGYRRGAFTNPALGMSTEEANSDAMDGVISDDWLAENFGVRFRYNAIGDVDATLIIDSGECFGITENVSAVAMHAGSTIAITDPAIAKGIVYLPDNLTSGAKWSGAVDAGVYNAGGVDEGAYVAIAKVGQGKAAFIGDSSAVEDSSPKYKNEETGRTKTTYDGFSEDDDATFLLQLTDWLAEQENYTDFLNTGITLDSVTTLYSYETPALSAEPETEPWATPSPSYKWYDESTFKSGSYGYVSDSSGDETTDTYTLGIPQTVVTGQELPLTVYFSGLETNTTYSGFSVGAYLSGGTQIAKFTSVNGILPSTNGYSDEFSVTTDSNGDASQNMIFVVDAAATGTFNMRLKQSGTTLLTESCSISESSSSTGVTYEIYHPVEIDAGMETAITITINNLAANETVSLLKAGSYLSGGTQIAMFSIDGTTWTGSYGYSGTFSMTAGGDGNATKTILMKVQDGVSGDASLRIKKGTANMVTQTITIR